MLKVNANNINKKIPKSSSIFSHWGWEYCTRKKGNFKKYETPWQNAASLHCVRLGSERTDIVRIIVGISCSSPVYAAKGAALYKMKVEYYVARGKSFLSIHYSTWRHGYSHHGPVWWHVDMEWLLHRCREWTDTEVVVCDSIYLPSEIFHQIFPFFVTQNI